MEVILNDIKTMYVKSEKGFETAKEAFDRLETGLKSLKGRKFYGVLYNGVYLACVELTKGDEPKKLGFEIYIIPGGKYIKEKINDWTKHLADIGPVFDRMIKKNEEDISRPKIEFYKSQRELFLLLPIK